MQETIIRYGVRSAPGWAGFPLVESITYVRPDYTDPDTGRPVELGEVAGAVLVDGLEGWWVPVMVADPLPADAVETDQAGFVAAWSAWHTNAGVPVPPLPALPAETVRGV